MARRPTHGQIGAARGRATPLQKEIAEQLRGERSRRVGWGTVNDGRALLSQLRSGLPGYNGGMGEAGKSNKKKGAMWRLVAEDVALPGRATCWSTRGLTALPCEPSWAPFAPPIRGSQS